MQQKIKLTSLLLYQFQICLVALIFFCSNEQNPFKNSQNTNIHIDKITFKNYDTLSIFSSETLSFFLTVRELSDSVKIFSSLKNRFWNKDDTTIYLSGELKQPLIAIFSLIDTGRGFIITSLHCKNNQIKSDTYDIVCQNPLKQPPLRVYTGDSVMLKSQPVKDNCIYWWLFNSVNKFSSTKCSVKVMLNEIANEGVGYNWVSDGAVESPKSIFPFEIIDTIVPRVEFVNTNYVFNNDTIFTSDSSLTLKFKIWDNELQLVDSVSINGKTFDRVNGLYFQKDFTKVNEYFNMPLPLKIVAIDNLHSFNSTNKTFYLKYVQSLLPKKYGSIILETPDQDFTTVGKNVFTMHGTVENNQQNGSIAFMLIYKNGKALPKIDTFNVGSRAWQYPILLDTGINSVDCVLKDSNLQDTLALKNIKIQFTPGKKDTVPPVLADILIDNKPLNGFWTENAQCSLSVVVFDGESGIARVLINGDSAIRVGNGNIYKTNLNLVHRLGGNEFRIEAFDSSENKISKNIFIIRNRLPVVISTPLSHTIKTYKLFTDTIVAIDPDFDSLSYIKISGPQSLIVTPNGIISWVPHIEDTGVVSAVIRLWDRFVPLFINVRFYVTQNEIIPLPIQFANDPQKIQSILESNFDTLKVDFDIQKGTGIPPFKYWVCKVRGSDSCFMDGISANRFSWIPGLKDTGLQQLRFVVKDQYPFADTFYKEFYITPPNRPCKLNFKHFGDSLRKGYLDLNKKRSADTIKFYIQDLDQYERHGIRILNAQSETVIDSALADSFSIVVDPVTKVGRDSIHVIIQDKRMHRDSALVIINYGLPPSIPMLSNPVLNDTIHSNQTVLRWNCSDLDSDMLTYTLRYGNSSTNLKNISPLTDSSYIMSNLQNNSTFYWQVIASDGLWSTVSAMGAFHVSY